MTKCWFVVLSAVQGLVELLVDFIVFVFQIFEALAVIAVLVIVTVISSSVQTSREKL